MIIKIYAQSEDKILIRHKGNILETNKLMRITGNFYPKMNILLGKYVVKEFGMEIYDNFRERVIVYSLDTEHKIRDIKFIRYRIL